jgi:hypothetical protein
MLMFRLPQALQAATQRIYSHVSEIENKMALLERKKS